MISRKVQPTRNSEPQTAVRKLRKSLPLPTRKKPPRRIVNIQAQVGTLAAPGGWIHLRKTIAISAAKPPFIPAFTQNQSIAGRMSQCRFSDCAKHSRAAAADESSGESRPKLRGKPSTAARTSFNSSRTHRSRANSPAKSSAVPSGVS